MARLSTQRWSRHCSGSAHGLRTRHSADLTPREREVLAGMAQGKTNAATAEALVLTPRAVEKHINVIFSKLPLDQHPAVDRRVTGVPPVSGRNRVAARASAVARRVRPNASTTIPRSPRGCPRSPRTALATRRPP